MDLQDLDSPLLIGPIDENLAIETPGAQQRRIEDLRPVGGTEDDDSGRRVEAVHLHEKLIQGLLLFVVPADGISTARAAERVQLVDEDDGRRLGASLLEQIAH